ncbi:1,5-anhydro-D-fructose reductase-like isoform X2 [Ctenocephalides felis]|uniref:1,5-anhydro-D-fructose reductase-like isoform X2 n=1 Tax=Ctenocephalides felis TaxID=7515 RepID=UPI000E6E1A13|nr:1,5-anhydro-D-fructose reductase-like isoform X2 [Ctenocephalides felis]
MSKVFFHNIKNEAGTQGEVQNAVKTAVDAGYRHFDCAYFYGNEKEVGEGLKAKINDGTVKREDLFVTSKLWNTYHSPESVIKMCRKSVENIGLGYLDLFLIHWPVAYVEPKEGEEENLLPTDGKGQLITTDTDYVDTWKKMEECVQLKLARSIGVSNFNSEQIDRILAVCKIKPVTNQVECSPNLNQRKLIQFCKERDIVVTGYTPLGRPHDDRPGTPVTALKSPIVEDLSKKYNKTPAQIVLRYLVEIGCVPIPKSVTPSRILENIQIFDFTLTGEDIIKMDGLNQNARFISYDECKHHKYFPFKLEF